MGYEHLNFVSKEINVSFPIFNLPYDYEKPN